MPYISPFSVQNLSTFRVEANMFKAKSSDESIGIGEALRYLRATKFNSSKAIDMFKNYHVRKLLYMYDPRAYTNWLFF